jgi:hypothetical protein
MTDATPGAPRWTRRPLSGVVPYANSALQRALAPAFA